MNCRECGRPRWDGPSGQGLCEGCEDRVDINRSLNFTEFHEFRNVSELTAKRRSDLSRGY